MSYFYSDLYSDITKLSKGYYGGYPIFLKFKTSPTENTKLSQTFSVYRTIVTKEDKQNVDYSANNKSALKTKCCNGEIDSKLYLGTRGLTYVIGYKPATLNTVDQVVQLKHKSEVDATTSSMDCHDSIKFSPSKIGPLKLWLAFALNWNTINSNKSITHSSNINYEDYHLGYTLDANIATKKLSNVFINLILKNSKGDFFLNVNPLEKSASVGCYHHHGANATHYYNVLYALEGSFKGAFGQPAEVNWASEYKLTDSATVKASIRIRENWLFNYAWLHRVNKNLKVGFSHSLDVSQVASGKATNPFNFGTFVQWTL